jgi:hypothetical protein
MSSARDCVQLFLQSCVMQQCASCTYTQTNTREVEPDYPPAAEGEPRGASTGVTTGGYWPQALAVATRFVICLILLNTVNREKVLGAGSDLGC